MSHEGCTGSFENGQQILQKVRMMGFAMQFLPIPVKKECECGESFEMVTFETECPGCGMLYAVTPCHAHDPDSIMPAGKID